MKLATLCVRGGMEPEPGTGAVIPPVYFTTTYHQEKIGRHKGFEYSRLDNPNRRRLETAVAALEGLGHAVAFGSGLAAEAAVMQLLDHGDTIVSLHDIYGGTYRYLDRIAPKSGIRTVYLTYDRIAAMEPGDIPDASMIWIESPTNPLLKIIDIQKAAAAAKRKNAVLVVDNTFATPVLQRPGLLGADIVVHSATKYLAGHSDVVLGIVAMDSEETAEKLRFIQTAAGAVPGPMDCWLAHRGLKTLKLRMEAHTRGASAVASALLELPGVKKVYYPGHPGHPGHTVASRQMESFGGMVAAELEGGRKAAEAFLESLEIFSLADSLGGVESLACHPSSMTHASMPEEAREAIGITEGLVRLSVGIEDPEDLVEDVRRALHKASGKD